MNLSVLSAPEAQADESKPYPPLPVNGAIESAVLRVCVISHEGEGATRNNGLGAAYTLLARALASAGHKVTFLYTGAAAPNARARAEWGAIYKAAGIDFIHLAHVAAAPEEPSVLPDWLRRPYDIYAWLKAQSPPFDIVHCPEYPGHAIFACLARHQGIALPATRICIGLHGPSSWARELNGFRVDAVRHLAVDFMERRCAALADFLVSPSAYMLGWAEENGWSLPSCAFVQPNILPPPKATATTSGRKIREIVFFGRLEPRKGYTLLCEAIALLPKELLHGITVTFLGKPMELYQGRTDDDIATRAAKWPCRWRVLGGKNREQALAFLSVGRRLAVIPSLGENSPYAVLECLAAGIPFIASHAGGIPELVAPEDRARVCFKPVNPETLARTLTRVLREGARPARPAFDLEANMTRWLAWHAQMKGPCVAFAPHSCAAEPTPRVTAIIVTREDARTAECATINSLEAQGYPNLEFRQIVASAPELRKAVEAVQDGWILLIENAVAVHVGAVRLAMRVARRTGADILTSAFDFSDNVEDPPGLSHIFLGPAVAAGMFMNVLGGPNAFMRRETFLKLAGRLDQAEAWDAQTSRALYVRAVLEGYRLEAIAEPLFQLPVSFGCGAAQTNESLPEVPAALQPLLETDDPHLRLVRRLLEDRARPRPSPFVQLRGNRPLRDLLRGLGKILRKMVVR